MKTAASATFFRCPIIARHGGPCVGTTLGSVMAMASRQPDVLRVAVVATFGIGAAAPLALFGSLSRGVLLRARESLGYHR